MPIEGEIIEPGDYRYTTEAEFITFVDSLNEQVLTDADRDGTGDATALEQGIRAGEGRVDLHTGGPYTFTEDDAGEVAAETFNRWSYTLAAYQLAAKRGFTANDNNEFIRNRDEVLKEMEQFRTGVLTLSGAIPPEDTTAADGWEAQEPIGVLPTVDPDGRTISDPPPRGPYYDPNSGGYRWQ